MRYYFASLAILASGAVHRDRLLLAPEEIEEAAKGAHEWRDAVVRQNLIALD